MPNREGWNRFRFYRWEGDDEVIYSLNQPGSQWRDWDWAHAECGQAPPGALVVTTGSFQLKSYLKSLLM